MWYGQEEKRIGELLEIARKHAPSIIFIDEIDGLFTSRSSNIYEATRRALLQFCSELDGIEELDGVSILAATNIYIDIDGAILRAGRFDVHLEVPKPNFEARREIFQIHTRNMLLAPSVNLDILAEKTNGKVGADIGKICNDAGFAAITRYLKGKGLAIEEIMAEKVDDLYVLPEDFKLDRYGGGALHVGSIIGILLSGPISFKSIAIFAKAAYKAICRRAINRFRLL